LWEQQDVCLDLASDVDLDSDLRDDMEVDEPQCTMATQERDKAVSWDLIENLSLETLQKKNIRHTHL